MVHSSHQHATRLAPSVGQGHNIPSMSPVGFPHLPPVPDYLRSPELRPTHPPYQPTTLPNRIASGYSNRKIVLKYPINREMSSRGGKLAPEVNRYVRMFLSRSRSSPSVSRNSSSVLIGSHGSTYLRPTPLAITSFEDTMANLLSQSSVRKEPEVSYLSCRVCPSAIN